ncbi:hypothetical protein BJY01DRAFT_246089 [Aspergillus pseudoustus]|uniref:Xylanolytic transcriptional activator regulatory domain-containing protein n=1 Tax=Aspergillus pseudoustus TaxID=1810923 RepID=A0ABR4K990_9EURO
MSSLALATVRQTISLLLFHCVMLIAQLFLDIHENCNTDPATLHAMFERACLLFDLGWETDELTLLQSALLLSHYPLSSMAARGPTYWLSQAVSFAYALGLHQGFTETSFCAREQSLRKQLWWSVYIRERLLTLDYDQPWMIWENAYDVPMLAVEDFDSGSLLPSDHDCSPLTSQYTTYQQQRQLALVFIEKAKAATIIGRLLPISIGDCGAGEQKDQCPLPRIQIRAPARAQLDQIDRDINSWAGQLPLGIRCDKPRVRGTKADARKIIFDLNHCMLFTLYYLVTSHLAALRWLEEASPSSFAPKHAIQALWAATRPLMNLADGLLDDNLLGYFQIIGPSLIRPLLVCKMLNNRAPPWMYPILEVERIPLLIGKIGWGDPFYAHAVLSLHIGDEDPSSSSVSDTCQTAAKDDSISTPTPPNIVDAVLGGFALPSDPSPSISSFEQVFASWGVSTTTTSVARLSC